MCISIYCTGRLVWIAPYCVLYFHSWPEQPGSGSSLGFAFRNYRHSFHTTCEAEERREQSQDNIYLL